MKIEHVTALLMVKNNNGLKTTDKVKQYIRPFLDKKHPIDWLLDEGYIDYASNKKYTYVSRKGEVIINAVTSLTDLINL